MSRIIRLYRKGKKRRMGHSAGATAAGTAGSRRSCAVLRNLRGGRKRDSEKDTRSGPLRRCPLLAALAGRRGGVKDQEVALHADRERKRKRL